MKNERLTPYAGACTYVFYDPYFTNRQLVVENRHVDILYADLTLSYLVWNCSNEHEHSVANYQYVHHGDVPCGPFHDGFKANGLFEIDVRLLQVFD